MKAVSGRALILGDDVNTDLLHPSRFYSLDKKRRAMGVSAGLGARDLRGGIIVAGRNFGAGSSRESLILAFAEAGVRAVVAGSISRIFHRNAINAGLPALSGLDASHGLREGDELTLHVDRALLICEKRSLTLSLEPLDPYFMEILASGGLLHYLDLL